MAAELQEENLTAPEQEAAPASAPEPASNEELAPSEEPTPSEEPEKQEEKPKEKRELLIPFLTVLLILLGIGEAVFWGGFGLAAYQNKLAAEQYEAQQKALEEERASRGELGGSAYGPNLKVENGTVTWEREKWVSPEGTQAGAEETAVPRREDGLRLSRLSVPRIPYALAQMEDDEPEPAPDVTDGTDAPTGT